MKHEDRRALQRWLDGELDGQERTAFEARLAEDPELRAELDLHQEVGASLRCSFAVPEITAPAPARPTGQPRWPVFVAGAMSAAALLLLWLQPWKDQDEALREAVGRSWLAVCGQPEATPAASGCRSPDQVPQYVQELVSELPSSLVWRDQEGVQFGRGLELDPEKGLRVIALTVLPQTEVYVFIVPASTDPQPVLPQDSGWRIFRKDWGPLVAYELTPLEEARGLECLAEHD